MKETYIITITTRNALITYNFYDILECKIHLIDLIKKFDISIINLYVYRGGKQEAHLYEYNGFEYLDNLKLYNEYLKIVSISY